MNAPNKRILQKVKKWISYAEEDLLLAKHNVNIKSIKPYRNAAFLAQQSAEKYLKGYLVYCGVDYPYTHDISLLLTLVSEYANWADDLKEAERLTYYSIITRYPREGKEVSKKEALFTIQLASKVRDAVRKSLIDAGLELPEISIEES